MTDVEAGGALVLAVQRNASAITGFYRLYVSKGEQVTEANHSAVEGLAECFQAGGRAAVAACIADVRRRLIVSGYHPVPVTAWTAELDAATSPW